MSLHYFRLCRLREYQGSPDWVGDMPPYMKMVNLKRFAKLLKMEIFSKLGVSGRLDDLVRTLDNQFFGHRAA